jgi:trimeric autotransporter adhesin
MPCRAVAGVSPQRILFVFLATLQFSLTYPAAAVSLPPLWRWSNPQPHGANIVDQAANAALTVQVGERGQIYLSDDWNTWIPRDSYTGAALRGVTFFGGRLVITGETGTVIFADDPWNFHGLTLGTSDWLESVAASTNVLVAVGDNAAIYTSTNAVNWQRITPSFNNWLRSVACSGSNFVAVGEGGLIASSQDGNSWQVRDSGMRMTNLNRVAWLGDHYLVVGDGGNAFSSPNGNQWSSVTLAATNHLYAAAGVTNSHVAAGNLEARLSEDNGSWLNQLATTLAAPAPVWTYYSALWNSGYYLLAGRSGMMVEGSKTNSAQP